MIARYVVLGPLGGNQAASDGRWASVFLVNFHFAADGTNYLSSLHASVLQNYWSLAVSKSSSTSSTRLSSWWLRASRGVSRCVLDSELY